MIQLFQEVKFIALSVTFSFLSLHCPPPPPPKGHVLMPCNRETKNYWILKQNRNHWVYSYKNNKLFTLMAAKSRKLVKAHLQIMKQTKQECELLFLACLRRGEALLQLLDLEP